MDWSASENEVIVAEYFAMLEQELAGQAYTKSRFNERVRALTGRGRGSVEFKFQNVSAALQQLHAPWVEGYKPAKNFQGSLVDVVAEVLATKPHLMDLMRTGLQAPAVQRVDVVWNLIDPPAGRPFAPSSRTPTPIHTDFVMLESANRSLGSSGEALVLAREREVLAAAGRPDLAERVEHASRSQGDGLGYDIHSWTPDEQPRLIEVKTTRRGELWPMFVSRNEVATSRRLEEHFVLARVFDFARPRVGLYELPGAIEDTCWLQPETYRALPKAS